MTNEVKHTPLPYIVSEISVKAPNGVKYSKLAIVSETEVDNLSGQKLVLAEMRYKASTSEEVQSTTEFIVRACNSHYELLEALETLVNIIEENKKDSDKKFHNLKMLFGAYEIKPALAAIKKAKGEN